jgi:hypothetical protein
LILDAALSPHGWRCLTDRFEPAITVVGSGGALADHKDRLRALASAVPMPSASGHECVRVLVSLGWLPLFWNDESCVVERGPFRITVPLDPALPSETLTAVLLDAGVGVIDFVDALEKIRTGRLLAYADDLGAKRKA